MSEKSPQSYPLLQQQPRESVIERAEMAPRPREVVSDTEGRITKAIVSTPIGLFSGDSDFSFSGRGTEMSESALLELFFLRQIREQIDGSTPVEVVISDKSSIEKDLSESLEGSGLFNFVPNNFQSVQKRWIRDYLLVAGQSTHLIIPAGMERVLGKVQDVERFAKVLCKSDGRFRTTESSPFFMDGGNVKSVDGTLFVGPKIIHFNLEQAGKKPTEQNIAEMLKRMSDWFSQPVEMLGPLQKDAPRFYYQPILHLDLCVTPLGRKKVAVGDVKLAVNALAKYRDSFKKEFEKELQGTLTHMRQSLGVDNEFRGLASKIRMHSDMIDALFDEDYLASEIAEKQAYLDAIAVQMREGGYEVVRIPLVPGSSNDVLVTYNNGLVEQEPGGAYRMYMPRYSSDGNGPMTQLDNASFAAITNSGVNVKQVRSGFENTVYGGSLNCRIITQRS